jgi:hypothetical protein
MTKITKKHIKEALDITQFENQEPFILIFNLNKDHKDYTARRLHTRSRLHELVGSICKEENAVNAILLVDKDEEPGDEK